MRVPQFVGRLLPRPVRTAVRGWLAARHEACPDQWAKAAPRWQLDAIAHNHTGATVSGWVVRRTDDPTRFVPIWNGHRFAEVIPRPRPDVVQLYPWLTVAAGWTMDGFVAHSGWHAELPAPGRWFRIEIADTSGTPRPDLGPPVCVQVPPDPDLPWPDPARRQRVHGSTDLEPFRQMGGTGFQRLRDALLRCFSTVFSDYPRVLDWGCGCGRVLRYFHDVPGCRVVGADIDADNLAWCRANLPFAEYVTVPLHPPTPLPADGFDLAFGLSVFTHLKEPDQFEWLAELARVVRPGGVVLVTYHGEAAVATSRLPKRLYQRLHRTGFLDLANVQYDADLPEQNYYRDTFHTDAYIRREWAKHFEVVDLLPMWIGSQDLAVLRRR